MRGHTPQSGQEKKFEKTKKKFLTSHSTCGIIRVSRGEGSDPIKFA
jgi:hypothetical protein